MISCMSHINDLSASLAGTISCNNIQRLQLVCGPLTQELMQRVLAEPPLPGKVGWVRSLHIYMKCT